MLPVDCWPEILNDIEVKVVPLEYLHSLKIIFKNGKIWNLPMTAKVRKGDPSVFSETIDELLKEYEDSIESMDFQLDIDLIKKDSNKCTKKLLKTKK